MSLLSKNYLVFKVTYLLNSFNKTKFFPWNTKNTARNGINKENTHTYTKHSEKDNIGKGYLIWNKLYRGYFRNCGQRPEDTKKALSIQKT